MPLINFARVASVRLTGLCVLLGAATVTCIQAQEFRALVSGRIVDSSDAASAGAQVEIVNTATQAHTTAVSGSDGDFALTQLPPGDYDLSVESAGFRPYKRHGITLAVGDKANLEIKMEVGDVRSSVEVTAELTGIEANQDITGQLMTNKSVTELPLNGRNVFMLVQLSAGVVFTVTNFAPGGTSPVPVLTIYLANSPFTGAFRIPAPFFWTAFQSKLTGNPASCRSWTASKNSRSRPQSATLPRGLPALES